MKRAILIGLALLGVFQIAQAAGTNHQYTRHIFSYRDKIGNPYNCFILNEGEMLGADFVDGRGWVAKVRHMDGSIDTYTFTGNASFIKVPDFGYSFCVRRD